jgi:hypothetical protein
MSNISCLLYKLGTIILTDGLILVFITRSYNHLPTNRNKYVASLSSVSLALHHGIVFHSAKAQW